MPRRALFFLGRIEVDMKIRDISGLEAKRVTFPFSYANQNIMKNPVRVVAFFTVLLLCSGCAIPSIVKREYGESYTYSGTIDCTYTGFCHTWMPGLDGKGGYQWKCSSFCSGKQAATILVQPVIEIYEDGTRRQRNNSKVIEVTGECRGDW